MKIFFGIFLVSFCLVLVVKSEEEEMTDNEKMILAMGEACIEKTKPNDADIKLFVKMALPVSKEGKCLSGCLMEQFQMIVDGKYVAENLISGMRAVLPGDDERLPVLEEIANECESETDEDVCELAYKVCDCLEKKSEEKGVKKD